jgi:ABC-type lipopolysaccharide export system ATPase subunit
MFIGRVIPESITAVMKTQEVVIIKLGQNVDGKSGHFSVICGLRHMAVGIFWKQLDGYVKCVV